MMLINENNYLGLNPKVFSKNITDNWVSITHDSWDDADYERRKEIINGFFTNNSKPYLITKKALEDIELIKISDKFDFTLLDVIPIQTTTYLINKNLCFKFYVDSQHLRILIIRRTPLPDGSNWLDYLVAHIHLPTGTISEVGENFKDDFHKFLKCLIFVEIAESELVIINSAQKIGTKKNGYYNLTDSKVIIVNSNWNKTIIRTEGFSVSGHFRLQRMGEGRKEVKLIWIEPFMKLGYVRQEG